MQIETNSKRQEIENLRLMAKMNRQKEEEAEKEAARVRELNDAANAVADVIN